MNQRRDGDEKRPADATRAGASGGNPRPGAPVGPPPPADSFRPAGPPPPADAFRPGAPVRMPTPGGSDAPQPGSDLPPGSTAPTVHANPPSHPAPTRATDQIRRRDRAGYHPGTSPYDRGRPEGLVYAGADGGYPPSGGQPPEAGGPAPARPRRRRFLLIGLVVLLALLVVADRVAVAVAKDQMASEIVASVEASLEPSDTPPVVKDVSIGGFPFLTQVLFGNYKDIGVVIEGIPTPGPRIAEVDANLRGVHVPFGDAISDNVGEVPVDDIKATVKLTYDDLNAYLATLDPQIQINPVDGGERVEIVSTVEIPFLGTQQVGGVTSFEVQDNMLTLVPSEVRLSGGIDFNFAVPGDILPPIPVPISGLPFDLRILDAGTGADGLSLTATAKDVVLPEAPAAPAE